MASGAPEGEPKPAFDLLCENDVGASRANKLALLSRQNPGGDGLSVGSPLPLRHAGGTVCAQPQQAFISNVSGERPVPVFLSHSRKDELLVRRVTQALSLLGKPFEAVVYENLPDVAKSGPDWWNIDNLIRQSESVFLFLTQNVEGSMHTWAWVEHEVAVASAYSKPLVVFQLSDSPPSIPITFWTDLVVVSMQEPESVLAVQTIARAHGPSEAIDNPVLRAIGGAALGSIAGPIGSVLGGLIGLISAPPSPLAKVPVVSCPRCDRRFRYWGTLRSTFFCPQCLLAYTYGV